MSGSMTWQDYGRRALVYGVVAALILTPVWPAEAARPLGAGTVAASGGHARQLAASVTSTTAPDELGPMTDSEMQGYGCLATGGGGLAVSLLAGHDELLSVIVGDATTATTAAGAVVTAIVLISASFCAVGALATPAVVRLWKYYHLGTRPAVKP